MQTKKKKIQQVIFIIVITSFFIPIDGGVLSELHSQYLIEQSNNTLRYVFYFDEPLLTEVLVNNRTFTTIEMKDCYSSAQPGSPKLPIYCALLLLPKGHFVENVQVTHQNSEILPYDFLMKPILPEQEFIRIGMEDLQPFVMNDSAYSSLQTCV